MIAERLLEVLRCPDCRSAFRVDARDDALVCEGCTGRVEVRNGIPRFIGLLDDELSRRTQASFGYEWTHFADWQVSGAANFEQYFSGLDLEALREARVLDAGCGMGRHALQIARHTRQVVAVDFSRAIDEAAKNTTSISNVDCVQADLLRLPFADETFDFIYSLGVLHHIADTHGAIRALVRKLRKGGRLRVYLYWKRTGCVGSLLAGVSLARLVTRRLPHGVLRGMCFGLSALLYPTVVVPYRVLDRLDVTRHRSLPLYVYARYPFRVLYNDQFDRFSAPLEKRFSREDVQQLMESAGLSEVTVRASFGWIADGVR